MVPPKFFWAGYATAGKLQTDACQKHNYSPLPMSKSSPGADQRSVRSWLAASTLPRKSRMREGGYLSRTKTGKSLKRRPNSRNSLPISAYL